MDFRIPEERELIVNIGINYFIKITVVSVKLSNADFSSNRIPRPSVHSDSVYLRIAFYLAGNTILTINEKMDLTLDTEFLLVSYLPLRWCGFSGLTFHYRMGYFLKRLNQTLATRLRQ